MEIEILGNEVKFTASEGKVFAWKTTKTIAGKELILSNEQCINDFIEIKEKK
jgi:hypothetical protein